jgi:hemoglobin-like flavoprotein
LTAKPSDPIVAFLARHELDPDDVDYLNERLARLIKVADRLAPIFFAALFERMPHVEEMVEDEHAQVLMYKSILWSAAACLKDPEAIHARLAELGESHAKRVIASLQLRTGEDAFLDSLSNILPKLEFRERRPLWEQIYQIIVDAMQPRFSLDEGADDT